MRYLEKLIKDDVQKRMVLLSGPRQCGKTTFAKAMANFFSKSAYLNWDQSKDRKTIMSQSWDQATEFLVLDEIHKKKLWKNFLKGVFDTKNEDLKILVTGSARLEIFQKAGDSMFGRFHSWRMHPFCLYEDPLSLKPKDRFERMLRQGAFPVPYLSDSPTEIARWRNQRWRLLLREDLRDLETVKDIQALELLAEILKNHAAGLISYQNLAEDAEKSPKTVKSWITILEKLYLVFLLTPYSHNLKRSISKTPKVYFIDNGDLEEQPEGVKVENLVAMNLLKRIHFIEDAYGEKISLHYVRDKEKNEVDFLIAIKNKPVALIEVKTSLKDSSPALVRFKQTLKVEHAIQLHADCTRKKFKTKDVTHISIPDFFSKPIEDRKFWEL